MREETEKTRYIVSYEYFLYVQLRSILYFRFRIHDSQEMKRLKME